jgi:excisionase family DNA binding protein
MSDPLGMSEPQAAEALSVHPSTLRRWRKNGAIGFTLTPGGRVRYSHEDVRRLLCAMRVEPTLGQPV